MTNKMASKLFAFAAWLTGSVSTLLVSAGGASKVLTLKIIWVPVIVTQIFGWIGIALGIWGIGYAIYRLFKK